MIDLRSRNFESEFRFRTSRSGGKGGQHVNKTETKVELIFDVAASALLSEKEKAQIYAKLGTYLNDANELQVSSAETRSQASNKEKVIDKFYTLLTKAFKKEKKRIATKMPKAVKEKIKKNKKISSEKKAGRKMKTRDFL